jgi:hypothetical protein
MQSELLHVVLHRLGFSSKPRGRALARLERALAHQNLARLDSAQARACI